MRLPGSVYEALRSNKIVISRADRSMVGFWNERRAGDELRYYTGFYWHREKDPNQEHGPFRSHAAACRDAYQKLQLRYSPRIEAAPAPVETNIRPFIASALGRGGASKPRRGHGKAAHWGRRH